MNFPARVLVLLFIRRLGRATSQRRNLLCAAAAAAAWHGSSIRASAPRRPAALLSSLLVPAEWQVAAPTWCGALEVCSPSPPGPGGGDSSSVRYSGGMGEVRDERREKRVRRDSVTEREERGEEREGGSEAGAGGETCGHLFVQALNR